MLTVLKIKPWFSKSANENTTTQTNKNQHKAKLPNSNQHRPNKNQRSQRSNNKPNKTNATVKQILETDVTATHNASFIYDKL